MDYEETNFNEEVEAEDSLPDGLVEDDGDAEEGLEEFSLDDIDEESEDQDQDAEEEDTGSEGPKEPGYVQRRISKAVDKAVAETEARFTAQLQAMEAQYAPIKERLMQMDAQELVRSGKVKDLETAMELVRYRQGQPAQQEAPAEQPRNERGQYVSQAQQAELNRTQGRIAELARQADKILEKTGIDPRQEYDRNPEVREAIIAGEMDFYDVVEQMQTRKKRPPSPVRSSNGVNGQVKGTIMSMSDEQFDKLVDRVKAGGVRFRE
jgi:phage host-nuclease inhibitor protein Gam